MVTPDQQHEALFFLHAVKVESNLVHLNCHQIKFYLRFVIISTIMYYILGISAVNVLYIYLEKTESKLPTSIKRGYSTPN